MLAHRYISAAHHYRAAYEATSDPRYLEGAVRAYLALPAGAGRPAAIQTAKHYFAVADEAGKKRVAALIAPVSRGSSKPVELKPEPEPAAAHPDKDGSGPRKQGGAAEEADWVDPAEIEKPPIRSEAAMTVGVIAITGGTASTIAGFAAWQSTWSECFDLGLWERYPKQPCRKPDTTGYQAAGYAGVASVVVGVALTVWGAQRDGNQARPSTIPTLQVGPSSAMATWVF